MGGPTVKMGAYSCGSRGVVCSNMSAGDRAAAYIALWCLRSKGNVGDTIREMTRPMLGGALGLLGAY